MAFFSFGKILSERHLKYAIQNFTTSSNFLARNFGLPTTQSICKNGGVAAFTKKADESNNPSAPDGKHLLSFQTRLFSRSTGRKPFDPSQYWKKCECCPEDLDCGYHKVECVYVFPCHRSKPTLEQPIPCPLPVEPPPPQPVPLPRLKPCFALRKIPECPRPCSALDLDKPFITPKTLRPFPVSDCPCIEPFVPPKLPSLRFAKNKVYQKIPEDHCLIDHCKVLEYVSECKCLPELEPKPCPCIEPNYVDPPPLKRLCIDDVQLIPECQPPECRPLDEPVLLTKKIPCFRNDCVCIEPPPLRMVKLKRLPKMCPCPPEPDPKCVNARKCEVRADDVCQWEVKEKKLKNWWCGEDKLPAPQNLFCKIHTRGQKLKPPPPEKPRKRCFSTLSYQRTLSHLIGSGLLPMNTSSVVTCTRSFQTSSVPFQKEICIEKEKKKEPECPIFFDERCPDTEDCVYPPRMDCKKKLAPYPSFSECGEYSHDFTCECKRLQPYLQPSYDMVQIEENAGNPATRDFLIIDPSLEEKCVLNELCRPVGETKTCEDFHIPSRPLRQKECFAAHPAPCDKYEQICDKSKKELTRTCIGVPKDRFYYRCQCICGDKSCFVPSKFPNCAGIGEPVKKKAKRGGGKRYYSTMMSNRRPAAMFSSAKRYYSSCGDKWYYPCDDEEDKCKKREGCAELTARPKISGTCVEKRRKIRISCQSAPPPKPKREVCPDCLPKFDYNECPRYKKRKGCCYLEPGKDPIKDRIPHSCQTPRGRCPCPERVRYQCIYPQPPCCVIECPYPAFSDCHPPFKRLKYNEQQFKNIKFELGKELMHRVTTFLKPESDD